MGYVTGAATSISNLLSAIESFAVAEGWTVNMVKSSRSDNATYGECLNLTKGDVCGAFFSVLVSAAGLSGTYEVPYGYGLGAYTYPTYSGGLGNMAQANAGSQTITNNLGTSGYVVHHLFGGPRHIHVVIEVTSGLFKHVGIGQIDKFGAVTTGVYNYCARWYNHPSYINNIDSAQHSIPFDGYAVNGNTWFGNILRADCDGRSPRYYIGHYYEVTNRLACGWLSGSGINSILSLPLAGVSTLTGRSVLWPIMVSGLRSGGFYSPLGLVPDIRVVLMDNINPGGVLTIGSDNWRVFPVIRKNGAAGQENSRTFGYAYLQRP